MEITSIWYEYEEREEPTDLLDGNSNVIFTLSDGSKWAAAFFTYKNIETLRKKNSSTGECNSGEYFAATDLILVSSLEKDVILNTLKDLVRSGYVDSFCSRIEE